jgi:predicted RNA-binding Zn-ribbon protein involved in translation (DUF1610 family)
MPDELSSGKPAGGFGSEFGMMLAAMNAIEASRSRPPAPKPHRHWCPSCGAVSVCTCYTDRRKNALFCDRCLGNAPSWLVQILEAE